ncbi:hypothetical protein WDU99_16530 [Microbacterium sp. Mu-80]|uniref:Amino acid-binding ACT domain-containing protein n=1 Tax=Microbacterium bandirmense TaxID=3122050 RepID=A0ABU8LG01_9MICO
MNDIAVPVPDGASSLARIGEILGEAKISLEGGGMWGGVAHYLVADGRAAMRALVAAGFHGVEAREAVVVPLDADVPGALGRIMARLADAGIGLLAQYSDHDNRKVLVVDRPAAAREALA